MPQRQHTVVLSKARRAGSTERRHVLPDVLAPGLRVVFCGTAAGAVAARVGAPYAGPGNRFWWVLHEIGLTPRELRPQEFRELPRYGIGLTDVAKHASGSDTQPRACGLRRGRGGREGGALRARGSWRSSASAPRRRCWAAPVGYGQQDVADRRQRRVGGAVDVRCGARLWDIGRGGTSLGPGAAASAG